MNWKLIKEPFITGEQKVCAFEADEPYTVMMLIGDLKNAGIEVSGVKYQSDEKDEDNFCGGNLSAKGFCDRYDAIRVKSKYGMNYEVSCKLGDDTFTAAMSDNGEGISYNKIALSAAADSPVDFNALAVTITK